MASYSYTRNLKEEELAPPEVHVYTKKELWENWWDYNLKWVVIGVISAAVVIYLILDVYVLTPKTDYQIAIVGPATITETLRKEISDSLSPLLEDVTGDGVVTFEVYSYMVDLSGYTTDEADIDAVYNGETTVAETEAAEASEEDGMSSYTSTNDYYMEMAGQVQFSADLELGETIIFILYDPENMQRTSDMLCYLDGSLPEDGTSAEWTDTVYAVSDCDFFTDSMLRELDGYYIARRNSTTNLTVMDQFEFYQPLWEIITEGATPYSEQVA